MIRTYTDEIRNETYVTEDGRLVELHKMPRHKEPCTGFCDDCNPRLGGCEDDNFDLEDEVE